MVFSKVIPGLRYFSWYLITLRKKSTPHQGLFATLPSNGDLRNAVDVDQLADLIFEHLIRHAECAAWIEKFLVQEETVRAGQVAGGAA